MSDLKKVLLAANIKRAVIVDDAYDEVPQATDLALDAENWTQFFDDLNDEDKKGIEGLYPAYNAKRADELSIDDGFIAALWNGKEELRHEVIAPLFQRYTISKRDDLVYLARISHQVICKVSGG